MQAVRAAEAAANAEIMVVLARRSVDHQSAGIVMAAIFAIAVPPALLAVFSLLNITLLLIVQLIVFLSLLLVFENTGLHQLLIPTRWKLKDVSAKAKEQFMLQGLCRAEGSHGVMIYISEKERYAEIVVGEGIMKRVPQQAWQEIIFRLTEQLGDDEFARGIIDSVMECGGVLKQYFPRLHGGANKLPDHVVDV